MPCTYTPALQALCNLAELTSLLHHNEALNLSHTQDKTDARSLLHPASVSCDPLGIGTLTPRGSSRATTRAQHKLSYASHAAALASARAAEWRSQREDGQVDVAEEDAAVEVNSHSLRMPQQRALSWHAHQSAGGQGGSNVGDVHKMHGSTFEMLQVGSPWIRLVDI